MQACQVAGSVCSGASACCAVSMCVHTCVPWTQPVCQCTQPSYRWAARAGVTQPTFAKPATRRGYTARQPTIPKVPARPWTTKHMAHMPCQCCTPQPDNGPPLRGRAVCNCVPPTHPGRHATWPHATGIRMPKAPSPRRAHLLPCLDIEHHDAIPGGHHDGAVREERRPLLPRCHVADGHQPDAVHGGAGAPSDQQPAAAPGAGWMATSGARRADCAADGQQPRRHARPPPNLMHTPGSIELSLSQQGDLHSPHP